MPSIKRPNAPDRLPSADFGDLFFKPRALRTSEARSAVTNPSPLTTPGNVVIHRRAFRSSEGSKSYSSSPLASPAILTTHRRPLHAVRSESSTRSAFSRETSEAIEEEPIPLGRSTSSAVSSVSNRARKSVTGSDPHGPSPVTSDERAPREARAGFKWTRDFLGGWLEIRVGRQRVSGGEEANEQARLESDEFRLPSNKASTIHLPLSHSTTTADSAGHDSGQPLLPETPDSFESASTLEPLKEGLYCRTKRRLGLKHGPISPYIEPRSRTPTGAVLDRVTSTLRFLPARNLTGSTSAATSVSNLSIAAPRRRRERPGHRSGLSASSSVRDLMMGNPPAGTPEPELMYTGSDSNKYLSVDLTQPDAPAFLPSEARRINTPPLPGEGSGEIISRSFFFDYQNPAEGDLETFPRRAFHSPHAADIVRISRDGEEWYRVKLDAIESATTASQEEPDHSIPEHFPNSPLCPRNPKHKSGGTGTCPFHGRNKSTPPDVDQTPTPSKTGMLTPVPENWW